MCRQTGKPSMQCRIRFQSLKIMVSTQGSCLFDGYNGKYYLWAHVSDNVAKLYERNLAKKLSTFDQNQGTQGSVARKPWVDGIHGSQVYPWITACICKPCHPSHRKKALTGALIHRWRTAMHGLRHNLHGEKKKQAINPNNGNTEA